LAKKYKLPNAEKKDSQGICFLGKVSLKEFLKDYIKEKPGKVLDISGKVVGEHKGAHFYTIGQRGGLGIGGYKNPQYIAKKDVKKNIIVIAEEGDEILSRKEIDVVGVNWIVEKPAIKNLKVLMRVRYRQPLFSATIKIGKKLKVIFDKKQKFIASGQSAVFYTKKGEMLGGGTIL